MDQGRLAVVVIAAIGVYHLYYFPGPATSQAMDQPQIGRHIANRHRWTTNFIRPRALGQLAANHNKPQNMIYDTHEAPLPPLVDAIALRAVKSHWEMTLSKPVYIGDTANDRVEKWLAASGAGFGLLALSHALALWIFAGAFIFLRIHFRSQSWLRGIVLAVTAMFYVPWLIRNLVLAGSIGGVAIYTIFDSIGHPKQVTCAA